MSMIKSYTDLEQSKKLLEILPLESADMFYYKDAVTKEVNPRVMNYSQVPELQSMYYSPCWSLAALIGVIRETIGYTLYGVNNVYISCDLGDKPWKLETEVYDNEVDACYEMILKLNELKLL